MAFFRKITKSLTISLKIIYFFLAVIIILGLSYILGSRTFWAGRHWGTDTLSAISIGAWIDKYFPRLPFWYPLAGGGVSLTHSYPIFSFYLVSLINKITSLNFIQSFAFLGGASVPVMALGIYLFVSLRLKSQTIAFLTALFYLLSPLAWAWLFDWGFYAEAVAHLFVMPAIIFWDLFFCSFLKDFSKIKIRLFLVLAVIFLALTFLCHFGAGMGLVGFFGFYLLGYFLKTKKEKRKKFLVRGLLAFFLVLGLAFFINLAVNFSFYRYSKIAGRGGLRGGPNFEQTKGLELKPAHVLGLKPGVVYDQEIGNYFLATRHISFPAVVSILAFLGILLSFQEARWLSLALFSLFALGLSINAHFLFWALNWIPWPLSALFVWRRTFVPLRLAWPGLAALGAVGIFKTPFLKTKTKFGRFFKQMVSPLAGLILAISALYYFGFLPKPEFLPLNYGALGLDLQNIWGKRINIQERCLTENSYAYLENQACLEEFEADGKKTWCQSPLRAYFLPLEVRTWCQDQENLGLSLPRLCLPDQISKQEVKTFWQACQENKETSSLCQFRFESLKEQLQPSAWPQPEIADQFPIPSSWFDRVLKRIVEENPQARLDFAPSLPALGMLAPSFNLDRDFSQLYLYTVGSSSLIRRFRGQQVNAFYVNDPFYGQDPGFIDNLSRWFGINYLFPGKNFDFELFQKAGWSIWDRSPEEADDNWSVLKFLPGNSLADLARKPAVLIIGQNRLGAYDQVFLLSSYGALPYQNNWLVWGQERIDSYQLEELKNFDALFLHGYSYKNQIRADELLLDYVKTGGRVFIDTGWQYDTPDWETEEKSQALEIIPFKKLVWKDLGKTAKFVLGDQAAYSETDVSRFGPLVYQDQPWGVSTGERTDLKSWAKVVLSAEGYPLIVAGELGQGRVVWSGMNLVNHAKQGEIIYDQEIELLTALFDWLNEGQTKLKFGVDYQRLQPGQVEFTIRETGSGAGFLLWKEAYHPDFRAQLVDRQSLPVADLKIYRAGPGMTLIKVPRLESGERIIYQYQKPLSEKITIMISVLALIFLPLIVLEVIILKEKSLGQRLMTSLEKKLNYLFFKLWRKPLEWWQKDEIE